MSFVNMPADLPPAEPANANGCPSGRNGAADPSIFEWDEPTPLDDSESLPPFPVDMLPSVLRNWVLAVAEATQTPADLAAMLALATIAAIVQKKYEVEIKPGWVERLSLYVLVALESGERKSAVFSEATRPLVEWESERALAMAGAIQDASTLHEVQRRAYDAALKTAAKTQSVADRVAAQQLRAELDGIKIPVVPSLIADDITMERLGMLLAEQGGRMAVLSPEGGIFDTIAGRYANGVANLDVVLKGHSGDLLKVERVGRATVHVPQPALTLGLAIQPSVLDSLAARPEFRGRGLLARFFYALPPSKVGYRNVYAKSVTESVRDSYGRVCRRLLELPEQRDAHGAIVSTRLELDDAARARLLWFAAELEPRLRPGADLIPARDWAAKLVGGLARVAALLHLVEGCERCESYAGRAVDERTLERTEELATYLLDHTLAAFRAMGADPAVAGARKLLAYLETLTILRTTRRELQQALRGTFPSASDIDAPLALLEEHGYLRVLPPPPSSPKGGRPPSPVVLLNPRAFSKGGAGRRLTAGMTA